MTGKQARAKIKHHKLTEIKVAAHLEIHRNTLGNWLRSDARLEPLKVYAINGAISALSVRLDDVPVSDR